MTSSALSTAGRIAVAPIGMLAALLGFGVGSLACFTVSQFHDAYGGFIPMLSSTVASGALGAIIARASRPAKQRQRQETAYEALEFERAKLQLQHSAAHQVPAAASQQLHDEAAGTMVETCVRIGRLQVGGNP